MGDWKIRGGLVRMRWLDATERGASARMLLDRRWQKAHE